MQTDYLQFIFQAINNLLTQNLGFFDAMGQNMFRIFATILVVWYGVKSALSAAGGKHLLHFENFASLILTISFGFGMVNYYSTPIPGIGSSFHNLITDESQFLANKINQNRIANGDERRERLRGPHGLAHVRRFPGDIDLRRHDHLARGSAGHRHRGHRLRIYRHGGVCLGGADLHSIFHRSASSNGSSGDGSRRSSNMRSTKSSPLRSSTSSATCILGILRLAAGRNASRPSSSWPGSRACSSPSSPPSMRC